jgi:hypothetical protein
MLNYQNEMRANTPSNFEQNNVNNKSIYTKCPHLFRYNADRDDRIWLADNNIIVKKNYKCYILILDEVENLFDNLKFDFTKNNEFKSFMLPDSIIKKLQRKLIDFKRNNNSI